MLPQCNVLSVVGSIEILCMGHIVVCLCPFVKFPMRLEIQYMTEVAQKKKFSLHEITLEYVSILFFFRNSRHTLPMTWNLHRLHWRHNIECKYAHKLFKFVISSTHSHYYIKYASIVNCVHF